MNRNFNHFQRIAFTLLLGGSVFFLGCQKSSSVDREVKLRGETMGTFYQITLAETESCEQPQKLKQDIEKLLELLNRQMSTYLPESEISTFNKTKSTDWFTVSSEFLAVVTESLKVAEQTEGAFDPTVAPLVNLWHFGADASSSTIPTEELIEQTRNNTGYQKLHVRREPPAIRKEIPELQIDLSAIAKGDAVDRVAMLLEESGYRNYLVNIGGEVVARGKKTAETAWRLGIEKPIENKQEVTAIVELTDAAMATSGDYRNFYVKEGKKYSHTISPHTGKSVTHSLRSVSVVATTCSEADAFATAMMVLGQEKAWEFAEKHQRDVYLIYEENGKLTSRSSMNFPIRGTQNTKE